MGDLTSEIATPHIYIIVLHKKQAFGLTIGNATVERLDLRRPAPPTLERGDLAPFPPAGGRSAIPLA